jgi:hypothetical protein
MREMPIRPSVKKHAARIGEIAWAWNNVCTNLLAIFAKLLDPKDYRPGISIWTTLQNDKSQRDILIALAKVRLSEDSQILKELIWTCDQIGQLSGYRNAFIHAPIRVEITLASLKDAMSPDKDTIYVPADLSTDSHFRKLGNVHLETVYLDVLGDLQSINHYISAIFLAHARSDLWTLPDTPSMRVLLKKGLSKNQTRRRGK